MKQNSTINCGLKLLRKFGGLALSLGLVLPAAQAQTITFPRNADFNGTDANGFFLGGSAYLTAAGSSPSGGTPIDAVGSGTLRLTDAVYSAAGYAVDNSTFATPNGFSISFDFFSYGTTSGSPADGFTVFLVDGEGTTPGNGFSIGGFGGSLGYAPRRNGSFEPGVTKGYLGIGIDEFGNFGIPSEGKTGGYPGQTNLLPNAVTLRGPYNSADPLRSTGYGYIAGSNSLPFNLAVGTSSSNPGSRITNLTDAGYRKAYINVIPVITNGVVKYRITVRIQYGQKVVTNINNIEVTNPPSTLRIGFAGSTGGNTSIHEIRALAIVQAPIAIEDDVQTKYNQPITIKVLNNDVDGGGADINPATVDLDPNTVERETSYLVPGQGTFNVDDSGVVTFTPTGTFSGVVSIPYTILNLNSNLSNPGSINVDVTGAEVATVVSGPATVSPGQMTSLVVTTTNNGQETAQNVIPMLTLPAGFTVVGPLPAGADATTTNGITTITFAQATLDATQAVTNSVQVQAATMEGNYTAASDYMYLSGAFIPDAVVSNNASTLVVAVAAPLPVQLTAFTATAVGTDALLNWETAQEVNNHYFEVERSLNGATFASIGTVAGKGTTSLASTYRHVDAGASTHTTDALYYRLRQVDNDGRASFSAVQTVHFHYAETSIALYPNPAIGSTTLDLRSLPAGNYTVQVFETMGRLVHQATYQPGQCLLPLSGLAAGTYFVKIQGNSFNKVLPLSWQ